MRLGSIQLLRALAAIMVVYTHSICSLGSFVPEWRQGLPARTALGTFGVDLFFVISGFVIYRSAGRLSGKKAAGSFLWHRFRRINPVYYIATLISILVWLPAILRHDRPSITGTEILSSIVLLRYPGSTPPLLIQAWSLYFEWYFYAVFFLLILLRIEKKGRMLTIMLGGMVVLGCLTGISFYTDPYIVEFLLGVSVGYCSARWTPGRGLAFALLLPGILLALLWISTGYAEVAVRPYAGDPFYQSIHALGWGSAAALIVAGCVFLEKNDASPILFRHRAVLLLGDASYSIYLFHYIVLGAIAAVYLRVGFFLPAGLAVHLQSILMVAGSLLFYKLVEKPLLKALQRRRPLP